MGTSTPMESDILVQRFGSSVPMYGVIYRRMIGDGDSSVYNKITEASPYSNIKVEKIERRNHLRNSCNKLKHLTQNTGFYFVYVRGAMKGAIKDHKRA
jgi:hypothetical protein